MTTASRPLNKSVLTVEWGENEIRRIVKDAFFSRLPLIVARERASKIVDRVEKDVTLPNLKRVVRRSLMSFFWRQWNTISFISNSALLVFLAYGRLTGGVEYSRSLSKRQAREIFSFYEPTRDKSMQFGVPLQKESARYFRENVEPIFRRLMKDRALDPDAPTSRRTSLRAKAELEARYQYNLDMVEGLREAGNRLVVCSSHADCSKRCRPWQGRVYSLDGTRGRTDDGREFVPLEEATDHYYTTRAGVRWKNGLLGFNCRHYLVPYKKGLTFGRYSEAVEKRQYQITLNQRAMEIGIRDLRIKAITYAGTSPEQYIKYKREAEDALQAYKDYSRAHGRAFYISRTEI
jgi:hypothetical protein